MYTIEELQEIVSAEIEARSAKIMSKTPSGLYEPVGYSLKMGGKRLRPVMLLMAYNMFSDEIKNALPAAIGIEVFHNFTLLHDDIMDNAEVRRNCPTVHKKFGENSAILSGDAMAFLAYDFFMECNSPNIREALQLFSRTAVEVCEGQQFDMDFETRMDVTVDEYVEMIRLKTAVLLACCLKTGAILAGAPEKTAEELYDFGINLGLAFQLQDDLLDTFGDQSIFGKKIGGDILANKKTFLLINALEKTSMRQNAKLVAWIEKTDFSPKEKIKTITDIYESAGIKDITEKEINAYFKKTVKILKNIRVKDTDKQHLSNLSYKMLKRKY